jgi:3-hydroxybutyryl-CoA dehydrogenase
VSQDHTLLVAGAGTMGAQIALQAALHGIPVHLVDVSAEQLGRGVAANQALLDARVAKGRLGAEDAAAATARISTFTSLADAAPGSDWAIEAVVEDEAAKRQVFAQLAAALPAHAGIASNSSTIVVSRLAGATERPELCCNMHFFHPVTVMDLCEVVRGPQTAETTIERAVRWCERMGRTAVVMDRETDGFIVNRIVGAAMREAFDLAAQGFASFRDIDVAVRNGLRWPLGPFQLADFSGLDTYLNVRRDAAARSPQPGDAQAIEMLDGMVAAGRTGRKSGRGFYDYDGGSGSTRSAVVAGHRLGDADRLVDSLGLEAPLGDRVDAAGNRGGLAERRTGAHPHAHLHRRGKAHQVAAIVDRICLAVHGEHLVDDRGDQRQHQQSQVGGARRRRERLHARLVDGHPVTLTEVLPDGIEQLVGCGEPPHQVPRTLPATSRISSHSACTWRSSVRTPLTATRIE